MHLVLFATIFFGASVFPLSEIIGNHGFSNQLLQACIYPIFHNQMIQLFSAFAVCKPVLVTVFSVIFATWLHRVAECPLYTDLE